MFTRRTASICVLFFCLLFTSCAQTAHPANVGTPTPGHKGVPTVIPSATPSVSATRYTSRLVLSGRYRPDDLVFDPAGHLIFSDIFHGTINRLNADGSVTILASGLGSPEGLVYLPNGALIIAEQQTNRILEMSPSSGSLRVLRMLPGVPSRARCKDGVDGIALDPTTQTLIVPDSPTGNVYRMSLDGRKLTLLASHIVRPVGAAVDAQGNVYVADECGGSLWKITSSGATSHMDGFGMLDDVAFDPQGNILVTDLKPSIHALIRVNLATGQRATLASQGFSEPQGLVVDTNGNIFLSDDAVNKIVEYSPTR